MTADKTNNSAGQDIAIVGMAVNVPGAQSTDAYWENLRNGVESIRRLSEEDLIAAGEDPAILKRKNYVPAAAVLEGYETFDADFFGFSPKDAAILDPQHRKFLEVSWEAMEQAGHPPETIDGPIGVYAGCGMGSYFYFNICSNPDLVDDVGMFLLRHTGNDKDFLSTRVSHVFDLTGPSINLQTACSTSLVAIHYACQALRAGEIDMALAGGVTIELPQGRGYEFKENEILSPDGHCHAFDHRAQGTVFGSGAGAVALRRLEDAIADGDHIWAVIKGSAVNNDGAAKAGYLAPSVDGQVDAITKAMDAAGVAAQSIGYVECHGTGTYLGDPIEVAALTEAYRQTTDAADFCRLGSVKTNIGHLDTAAGVAGFVKTALSLHHGEMPPSLGYEAPNPAIPFEGSPFDVNAALQDWPASDGPRRAGINALGVGGTNAHAVLEQAPLRAASEESDWPFHVLCVSGRSKTALDANTERLIAHLKDNPDQPLADVAFTLKEGRRAFEKRRVVVVETHAEAARLLSEGDTRRVFTHDAIGDNPDVVFMFPGGGAQHVDMARDLYETEPVFAEWMDHGLNHLAPKLDYDLRALWLPDADTRDAAAERLKTPSVQLPLIAIVEYALAQLWLSWGVKPAAMVGHSMGENVAACMAGVMTFENLIDLVLLRGQLFDEVPEGGMLSISAPLSAIEPLLGDDLDIASVNASELIAVSGPQAALDAMQKRLEDVGLEYQRIAIDIAAHSRMLEPILGRYRDFLAGLDLQAPQMPFASNRTGQMITAQQATDPDYWVGQLRNTVNFADCITTLSAARKRVYLEVGPGKALSALAQMHSDVGAGQVLSSLRHPDQDVGDDAYFVGVIGRLWACGVQADWTQIWGEARRNRVVLPSYAFQRASYFIEPCKAVQAKAPTPVLERHEDMTDWGYIPNWRPRMAACDVDVWDDAALAETPLTWLAFEDAAGTGATALMRLKEAGHRIIHVTAGDSFAEVDKTHFTLAPEQGRMGYDQLITTLKDRDQLPDRIAHFWLADNDLTPRPGSSSFDAHLEQGFWSLTWLAQSLTDVGLEAPLHISVFTRGAAQVRGEALSFPEKTMISGPVGVLAREVAGVTCAAVDLEVRAAEPAPAKAGALLLSVEDTSDSLLEEMLCLPTNLTVAHRGAKRYEMGYKSQPLTATETPAFRENGVYLITGGFGGIGQTLAADILRKHKATVVLLAREAMPVRDKWDDHIARHGTIDRAARRMQAVIRLEALAKSKGGSVKVVSGNIVNLAQMRRVVDGLKEAHGSITGVIHAAGVLDDAPILGKTDAAIDAVLAPKVQGLRVIDQLLPDGALEMLVLFASTSTATRAAGQVDYVAANAWLNAFATARAGGKTRVTAVNWGVWADAGMAAAAIRGGADASLPAAPVSAGLLQRSLPNAAGVPTYGATLKSSDWILDQHRTKDGTAVLPGTGFIELLSEAARAQGLSRSFAISDLYFLRAMPVQEGEAREVQVTLTPEGRGFAAEIRSACLLDGKPGWQLHAQANISVPRASDPAPLDLEAIAARCGDIIEAPEGERLKSPQEAHLDFGPRWHVLRATTLGDHEGMARLRLPAKVTGDLAEGHVLHAGLMDLATGWAIELAEGYGGNSLWVPVSYGEIKVHAALPDDIYSWVRSTPAGDGDASFDVVLCDAEGRVLVEVTGFAMKRLEGGFAQTAPLDAREVTFEDEGRETLSPAEERLAELVNMGIRAAEGPEALARALALNLPQVMVTSLPLPALIAQADVPLAAPIAAGQTFERPDLDGTFVAPRTPNEEKLAVIWESLLGVSPVGVEDSFFDLGGHSLIAVRLFATIKREMKADFPISVLFEAPTIAKCAALIAEQTGVADTADGKADPKSDAAPAPARFEYLVPLNQSAKPGAIPMFVVAGMFGNILNLRHLAMQFSAERPVYGIQAKGLIGDSNPHTDMGNAAADYIAEIKRIQPKGPYLLSGYSGGGVTAYEMAQQLSAAGETVATLAMLDTPLPVRPTLSAPDKALIKIAELRAKGPGYFIEWIQNRRAWNEELRNGPAADGADGTEFNNTKIQQAFLQAVGSYTAKPYGGLVALFRPPLDLHWKVSGGNWVTEAKEYAYADNQWGQYIKNLSVVEVPGDHDSMVLSPNVTVLAQELSEIIAEALGPDADEDFSQATAAE